MWAQIDRILREATNQIADQVAHFLPGLLVALLLVLATVIVAVLVRALLVRALRGLEFDQWAERSGLVALVGRPVAASPSNSLSQVVYWTILFMGLLVSLTALNATKCACVISAITRASVVLPVPGGPQKIIDRS